MKDNTKKTLKIYLQHASLYKVSGILALVSFFLADLLSVIIPLYFKNFFDILSSGQQVSVVAEGLVATLLIIAFLSFLRWFFKLGIFFISYFESNVMADLANTCFAYLHKHSFSFFENNFVGSLVKRVQWFTKAFETVADKIFFDFLSLAVSIVFIVIVLFTRNFWLGFVLTVWLVVFLVINYSFSKYKLKYDIQRAEAESETTGYLADTITNNSNVKFFTGYKREKKAFAKLNETVNKLRTFTWNLGNIFESFQAFLMFSLQIGIFYLAIKLWQKGLLTLGDFVLIQSYLISLFMMIWNFGRVIVRLYESLSDAEEMTVIFNTPHQITDALNAKELQVSEGKIEFVDVDFNYHKTRKILQKFNLTIKPGEKVALIGPSGAGKTTVVKLLLRVRDIDSGKILVDGQRVSKVTQESLWQNISLVPQDPILFHRTLKENISYGRPKATESEIIQAAKLAHCHEFIKEFPDGYKTYVGERGIKLSGGERQRVAIARAILHNAPILVLDEATSSLDSESEMLIQDALEKLMVNKTVIVIAHRLSTIRKMDRIVVVDKGKVVEAGTHEELASHKSGIYKKLWELQAGGFIED